RTSSCRRASRSPCCRSAANTAAPPRLCAGGSAQDGNRGARGSGRVFLEGLSERRQAEYAPVDLGKQTEPGERPQVAMECSGVESELAREIVGHSRPRAEAIRE